MQKREEYNMILIDFYSAHYRGETEAILLKKTLREKLYINCVYTMLI